MTASLWLGWVAAHTGRGPDDTNTVASDLIVVGMNGPTTQTLSNDHGVSRIPIVLQQRGVSLDGIEVNGEREARQGACTLCTL